MASTKELKQIIKLATARRDTLIKRLNVARDKYDDIKCDQLMMRLQGENEIIGDCKRLLQQAEDKAFFAKFAKEAA